MIAFEQREIAMKRETMNYLGADIFPTVLLGEVSGKSQRDLAV